MKIGIDVFGSDHARSGIGTYLVSFVSKLPKDNDIEFKLFGSPIDRYTYTSGKAVDYISVDVQDTLNAQRLWHFTNLNKFVSQNKLDAVLYPSPDKVLPINFKVPGVAVVNSVLSDKVEGKKDWIQKLQIKRGLYKVDKIIAGSNFIKNDLVSHGISEDKISVIYNGIDHKLFYPIVQYEDDVVNVKPFAIKKPYFIYSSRLSGPEKKHVELIKAFALFKKKTGLPHRLVLAGSDGAGTAEVHKACFDSSYASEIFLTGYFPHENLCQLYSGSEGCIFPSVSEGVGLSCLEAMACGVPVICSSSGVLPEIGEKAALYFDSNNVEEIENCMEKIVSDKNLKESMVVQGLELVKRYNWENTVSNTIDLLKKI